MNNYFWLFIFKLENNLIILQIFLRQINLFWNLDIVEVRETDLCVLITAFIKFFVIEVKECVCLIGFSSIYFLLINQQFINRVKMKIMLEVCSFISHWWENRIIKEVIIFEWLEAWLMLMLKVVIVIRSHWFIISSSNWYMKI